MVTVTQESISEIGCLAHIQHVVEDVEETLAALALGRADSRSTGDCAAEDIYSGRLRDRDFV